MVDKILFLDIDGVLNAFDFLYFNPENTDYHKLDINKLNLLKAIVDNTNCKIVISSTWRKDSEFINIENIKAYFNKYGFDFPIIGYTPKLSGFRGEEVATYLDYYHENVNSDIDYFILDDDTDFILNTINDLPLYKIEQFNINNKKLSQYWRKQKLIKTSKVNGLTFNDVLYIVYHWSNNTDSLIYNISKDYIEYIKNDLKVKN